MNVTHREEIHAQLLSLVFENKSYEMARSEGISALEKLFFRLVSLPESIARSFMALPMGLVTAFVEAEAGRFHNALNGLVFSSIFVPFAINQSENWGNPLQTTNDFVG